MLDIIANAILGLSTAAEIAIILILFRRGIAHSWTSLIVYESLQIVVSTAQTFLEHTHKNHAAGVLYWSMVHVFSAVQFWILLQIVLALFCWVGMHKRLLFIAIGCCLSVAIAGGSIMALLAPNVYRHRAGSVLFTLDRACMFSWCIFLILVILGSQVVAGIRWTHLESSMVVSFGIMSISELLSAEIVSRYGLKAWSYTWTANSAVYLLSTTFLALVLFRSPGDSGSISTVELKRALDPQEDLLRAHRERVECT